MSNPSPEFISLSYLLSEYGYMESTLDGKYVYYIKDDLPPIQLNSLKVHYTDLELSSFAVQVDETVDKFIARFEWANKVLEKFSKKQTETK